MQPQDGPWRASWKPHPRLTAFAQGLLDLVLPPRAFDGAAAQTAGLSAQAWNRITFLDGPVCDGCGAPFELRRPGAIRCVACQAKPYAFAPGPGRLSL
jgi:hypothetical protein